MSERTLGGIGWSSLGTVVAFVANLGTLVVLARLLGPRDFGILGAGVAVITIARTYTLSVGLAVVQRGVRLEDDDVRAAFAVALAIGLLCTALVVVAAPALQAALGTPKLAAVMLGLAPILTLRGVAVVPEALLQRELRFGRLSAIESISYLVGYAVVAIVLAAAGFGVWSLVAGMTSQSLLEAVLLVTCRHHPRALRPDWKRALGLLRSSGAFTLVGTANAVAANGDNLVVAALLGPTALGLYTRAYRLMTTPANLFGDAVDTVLFPALANVRNEPDRLATALRRGQVILALTISPVAGACFVLSDEIVEVALGPRWGRAAAPFRFLCLGMLFRIAYKPSASVLKAAGRMGQVVGALSLYGILVVLGTTVGHFFGLGAVGLGVSAALIASYLLLSILASRAAALRVGPLLSWLLLATTFFGLGMLGAWGVTTVLRPMGAPPLAIVLAGASVAMLLSTTVLSPVARLLGNDARWWHEVAWSIVARFGPKRRPREGPPMDSATRSLPTVDNCPPADDSGPDGARHVASATPRRLLDRKR